MALPYKHLWELSPSTRNSTWELPDWIPKQTKLFCRTGISTVAFSRQLETYCLKISLLWPKYVIYLVSTSLFKMPYHILLEISLIVLIIPFAMDIHNVFEISHVWNFSLSLSELQWVKWLGVERMKLLFDKMSETLCFLCRC